MKKVLLGAALVAAVLVPSASASHRAHGEAGARAAAEVGARPGRGLLLARVRLGAGLERECRGPHVRRDVEDVQEAAAAWPVTRSSTAMRSPAPQASPTCARTSSEYKTARDARRALVFWKKEDAALGKSNNPGFSVTSVPVEVPAPATHTSHFAYLTSYSASNIAPVSGIDEQVADGRYVLDIIVTAGVGGHGRGAGSAARREARRPAPARAQGAPAREAGEAAEAEGRAAARRAGPVGARAPQIGSRREGDA